MDSRHPGLLPVSAVGLGFVALLSVPALRAIVSQVRSGAPKDNFYEDRDGKSTPEAMAAFSNKRPKTVILLFGLLGLGTSIALSVITALSPSDHDLLLENWFVTAAWALIQLQATFLCATHEPVQVHDLGFWVYLSSLVTGLVAAVQAYVVVDDFARRNDPTLILRALNTAAALVTLFAGILIPRRPAVFFRDQPVDGQWTSSVLSRYTWSWARPIIDLASKKGDLDEKDVPQPDHTIRTEEVMADWKANNYHGTLLRALGHAYKGRFAIQSTVTVLRCFLGVGPFWAMLNLIQILTERGGGGAPSRELCALVVLLGAFTLVEQWMDGWVNYYSIGMISQPIRAQLSALVYEKALRRKNVKGVEKKAKSEDENQEETPGPFDPALEDSEEAPLLVEETIGADTNEGPGPADSAPDATTAKKGNGGQDKPSPPEEPNSLQSTQAVVNLVGIDTRRIAGFAGIQFILINSLGKLILNSAFLIQLIGWLPFVIGFASWALVLPFNTYFSKRYMKMTSLLMAVRDDKLKIVNEALQGIRQIKFSALEADWEARIMAIRDFELLTTWQIFLGDVAIFGCWTISPILLAASSLTTYALLHGGLSPSVAFVSISIFKSLEVTLGALPEILTMGFETIISVRRIDGYLKGPEMEETLTNGKEVGFENATVAWPVDEEVPEEDRFILRDLDFKFPAAELSVITGKTGTGKSLVLSALIGDVDLLGGKIYVPPRPSALERHDGKAHPGNWILPGAVAYVAQTPWLEGASLRDNIIFGLPLVESRYEEVIRVCALKKDLSVLADGDKTELGAKGINLSGGQKWRVTLARAIYSRAEILIMDDIFSAVDAHVGRQIFEECISGDICKGRTQILVTHHLGLVDSKAKFLVELGDGGVLHAGAVSDLAKDGTLEQIESNEQPPEERELESGAESSTVVASESDFSSEATDVGNAGANSNGSAVSGPETEAKKFTQEETREKGTVKSHVYTSYIKASGGIPFWTVCALIYISFEGGNLGRGWWIRVWTGDRSNQPGATVSNASHGNGYAYGLGFQSAAAISDQATLNTTSNSHGLGYYLTIYIIISLAMGLVGTLRFYWSFMMSVKASRTLFQNILGNVLRTPLRWLDTVPVGRVLNRLTSDFETIDSRLTMDLGMLVWQGLILVGVCVAASLVSPVTLIPAAVLILAAWFIGRKYLDGARPLKRIESTTKSPVFELFNCTLQGLSTLRAFEKTSTYQDRMYEDLDLWDVVSLNMYNINRWLSFRMSLLGTTFTTIVGLVLIFSPNVDGAMAGFTLSFALDFAVNIIMAIRSYAQLEMDMNSAERVIEYSELKTEPQDGQEPPAAWPTSGRIEVKDLVVSYAEDLPPVLKGLTFDVKDNERIGVVGRTGAGKSSFTLALFRFLEPRSGSVYIDGLDTSKLDIYSLRSRLSIIPQDPVLFSGTIRSNLDPFSRKTDEELMIALERVHLIDSYPATPANEPASAAASTMGPSNANIFQDLDSPVSESGGNLSQGQRQLLCLARAIVSRPKIMVLDEATSAVDMTTDALIQRSIREEFTDSTLLVIAHRLSTIIDFDRVLVLSDGKVAEFGTPKELWEKEDGLFRDMCEKSGEKQSLQDTIFNSSL